MWKYFIVIMKLGWYILWKTPKIFYIYHHQDKYTSEYKYNYTRKVMRRISKAFKVNYNIEGLENIPKDGNYVMYPNHQSNFDPLAFITLFEEPIHFIGKIEIKKMPYIGKLFEIIGSIYLDRDDIRSQIKTMRECQRRIEEEHDNFIIFPEGTRTRKEDRRMNEFKAGAFKPATSSKSYVIPVMLNGTYRVLDKNIRKKQYHVDIKVLKPISYEEYKDLSTNDLSVHVQELISQELEQSFINNPAE